MKKEIWVHGTAIQEESAPPVIERRGWGTYIRGNPSFHAVLSASTSFWTGPETVFNWFHFAPVLPRGDGVPSQLTRLFLLFSASSSFVRALHVWDGPEHLQSFPGIASEGEFQTVRPENTFILPVPRAIEHGLGVSIQVEFRRGPVPDGAGGRRLYGGEIVFSALGVEFEDR